MKSIYLFIITTFLIKSVFAQTEFLQNVLYNANDDMRSSSFQSSFIKDGNYYNCSGLENGFEFKSIDFQKTDLGGNIQTRYNGNNFNFSISPFSPTFDGRIFVNSFIEYKDFNYFVGYVDYGAQIRAIVGKLDDSGRLIDFFTYSNLSNPNSEVRLNKIIFFNNEFYVVGSYRDDGNSDNQVFLLSSFDLNLNITSSNIYTSMLSPFNVENSEGIDLVVNLNNDLCVVGNIYNNSKRTFNSPLASLHNYSFLSIIDINTKNLISNNVFGVNALNLETISIRKLIYNKGHYFLFGCYESTASSFQPLLMELDNKFNIVNTKGFKTNSNFNDECIVDVVHDDISKSFYLITKGLNFTTPTSFFNSYIKWNIVGKGSLYSIDGSFNIQKIRQLNSLSNTDSISFETICMSKNLLTNDNRLIVSGTSIDSRVYNKFFWYLDASLLNSQISSNCSFDANANVFEADIVNVNLGLNKTSLFLVRDVLPTSENNLEIITKCGSPIAISSENSKETLNIKSLENTNKFSNYSQYDLFSLTGQYLRSGFTKDGVLETGLPIGIYIVKFKIDNNNFICKKIVISENN